MSRSWLIARRIGLRSASPQRVDPHHPPRLGLLRGVEGDHPQQLGDRPRLVAQLALQAVEVLLGGELERRRQQGVLVVEVVVDQPGRHVEALGHVLHPRRREPALDDDLTGDVEDLGAPLGDRLLGSSPHCRRTISGPAVNARSAQRGEGGADALERRLVDRDAAEPQGEHGGADRAVVRP